VDVRKDESHLDKIEEEMSAFQDLCHKTSGKRVMINPFYVIILKSQGLLLRFLEKPRNL